MAVAIPEKIGIPTILGFNPKSQVHLDVRYQNNGVPYIDTDEVLRLLPMYQRALHLTVDIQGVEYWFDTDALDHLAPCNNTIMTSTDDSVTVTKTTNGYDLSVAKAELELYAANETELLACWDIAIASNKVTTIHITNDITFTATRQFINAYGSPSIKLEATQNRSFIANTFPFDINNITLTNIVFRTSSDHYFRVMGAVGSFYNCSWSDDVADTESNKKNIVLDGTITNGTGRIIVKQVTHVTQSYSTNVNFLLQPFIIENRCSVTGNLYIEILEMASLIDFNRFSRVLLTSTVSNCPFKVTGDESWFYAPAQQLPSTSTTPTNIASYASILKSASIDNLKAARLNLDNTGKTILGLDANDNIIKLEKDLISDSYDYWALKINNLPTINYGYLYNWYAITDTRNITNSGWHIPSQAELITLISYTGSYSTDTYSNDTMGGMLKESGTTHWDTPNTGADNALKLNIVASGFRLHNDGSYRSIRVGTGFMSTTDAGVDSYGEMMYCMAISYNKASISRARGYKKQGRDIRALKDSTTLTHGQTGTYTGNDGRVYKTICIGTQEWLSENLAETKYRDGSLIPEVTDSTAWVALTTGARCSYNNDESNAFNTEISNVNINSHDTLELIADGNISISLNDKQVTISSTGTSVTSYNDLTDKPIIPAQYTDADAIEAVDISNKEDIGVALQLTNDLATELTNQILDKEAIGVAAQLVSDLKGGVSTVGDTLKKLYDLIVSSYSEITVANITARNAYNITKLPTTIFVLDDGDSKWALYKATTTGTNATYVKISDPDMLNAVMDANAIRSALGITTLSGSNTGDNAVNSLYSGLATSKEDAGIAAGLIALLTKASVGLSNVDNTSDINKPVSTAQAAADAISKDRANHTGSQLASTISNFSTAVLAAAPAETSTTIKAALGISTLSGSNTGDQVLPTVASLGAEVTSNKVTSISVSSTDTQYPSAKLLYNQLAGKQASGTYLVAADITGKQDTSAKDASGGYAGMTLFKYNFKNLLNTFTSFLTNSNTAARTYTFPDKDGMIAMTSDLVGSSLQNRLVQIVTGRNTIVAGADKGSVFIPSEINNSKITRIECYLTTAGTTATTINIRKNGASYVLSTVCTIPANAKTSTGATAYVIDTANNTGLTDDVFSVEIISAGTNAAGLTVTLTFTKQ